jgi:hypothetical protein
MRTRRFRRQARFCGSLADGDRAEPGLRIVSGQGVAGFGGALFQTLRNFYRTDNLAFTFVSDEFNGVTRGSNGNVRALLPRSFSSLSQAEQENGQSRGNRLPGTRIAESPDALAVWKAARSLMRTRRCANRKSG